MQQKISPQSIATILIGSCILGAIIIFKSPQEPKEVSNKKSTSQSIATESQKAMATSTTSQTAHRAICSQLDKIYEGVSGFNIAQQEVELITAQGGAHTYGEIAYDSMRALITRLNIQPNDVFYDLGSGSGKFVAYMHLATKIGNSKGVELSETRYKQSIDALERMKEQGMIDENRQISFLQGNMLEADLSDATVIFMCATCFSEDLMQKLADKFLNLTPGLRIITLKALPEHPRMKLFKKDHFPTSWSDGSPFHYYELIGDK